MRVAGLAHKTMHDEMHANASENRRRQKKRLSRRLTDRCVCEQNARADDHGYAADQHELTVPA